MDKKHEISNSKKCLTKKRRAVENTQEKASTPALLSEKSFSEEWKSREDSRWDGLL